MTKLIRLHGLTPYDRSAKARWVLTELGLPFENRWLDQETKEHESTEYLRLNPMGRLPFVEIDDQVMFESGAICAYFADLHPERGLAPKVGSPERALYEQWMYFAASTLDPFVGRVMIIEDIPAGEVQAAKQSAMLADFQDAIEGLDRGLAKSEFLLGSRVSAADICVAYHLYFSMLWPELSSLIERFPRITAFYQRMKQLPSAVKANVFSFEG